MIIAICLIGIVFALTLGNAHKNIPAIYDPGPNPGPSPYYKKPTEDELCQN